MKLSKNRLLFIINSNIEQIVSFLQEDYGLSILEAFDIVYSSQIYEKLINTDTGLYLESAEYIYQYLKEEIDRKQENNNKTTKKKIEIN